MTMPDGRPAFEEMNIAEWRRRCQEIDEGSAAGIPAHLAISAARMALNIARTSLETEHPFKGHGMPPAITTSPQLQATLNELLQLPAEDRLELGDCLLASIDDDDAAAAWDEEIGRRIDEHEAGEGKSYPVREVIAELREALNEAD